MKIKGYRDYKKVFDYLFEELDATFKYFMDANKNEQIIEKMILILTFYINMSIKPELNQYFNIFEPQYILYLLI